MLWPEHNFILYRRAVEFKAYLLVFVYTMTGRRAMNFCLISKKGALTALATVWNKFSTTQHGNFAGRRINEDCIQVGVFVKVFNSIEVCLFGTGARTSDVE